MSMKVNREAVEYAERMIRNGDYVTDTDWSERQPSTDRENSYLKKHDWADYSHWFLGLDTGENDETKERFNFPFGDFSVVHRSGLIAARQRAGQYDYSEVESAADRLPALIDNHTGSKGK